MSIARYIPTLTFPDNPSGHRSVPLTHESTTIGRALDQDVVLPEPFVSRRHAAILHSGNSYEIVDQASTHGTFLNGNRIDRASLVPDDVLQFGSLKAPRLGFELQLAKEPGARATEANDLLATLSGLRPQSAGEGSGGQREGIREMEQLSFLLKAARQLNAGGAIDDILRALLQLTLQLTRVERGFVFLSGEDSRLTLGLGLQADGAIILEDSTVSHRSIAKAIESDSTFSISDTLTDSSASGWDSIRINEIRNIYCIPLRKRSAAGDSSKLLGLLYLDSRIAPGSLSEVDVQMLDVISLEAAALLHNALLADAERKARLASEELAVAAGIHRGLMSITLPVLAYAELEAKSVPCLEIGGDFFDAVALDDCLGVTIADVSGKGVSAAIVAATLQGIIHAQMIARQSLPEIAALINHFLCTRQVGKYATLVMLKLFPDGRVEYVNCGHIRPISILGGNVRHLTEANLVVGLICSATYTSAHCHVVPGEKIILATDGVTEAEDPSGKPFGAEGLDRIAHEADLQTMLNRVASYHSPNDPQDDCTMLSVTYHGPSASTFV